MNNIFKKIWSKKFIILLVVIPILLLGAYGAKAWQDSNAEPEVEIKTAKSTKGNVAVSIAVDGKTEIERRDLTFEIGGIVRGVSVKEGDTVKAWQTIAYLDVRDAQKNLEKVLRDYSIERNDFEEDKQITYPDGGVTDTIKRILEKNQWNLEKAVLDVELKDLARQKSYLTTPISGTVAEVKVKSGEIASTQNSQITVVDEGVYQFVSYVEDIEALKIKDNMVVHINFDALPDEVVDGHIVFVSSVATVDENDLSTYKVVVEMEETEYQLLDGLIGEAEIVSKEVVDVVKIPNTTVKREDGRSIVYVVKNTNAEGTSDQEQPEKRTVTLGFTNGKEVEVKEGLSSGETLIDWKGL